MEPMIGQIMLFAGGFAPRGWAKCEGQLLPVSQNSSLFAVIGANYGGDGISTFALPDLRGRAAVSAGQGPGLGQYNLGERVGQEQVALTEAQMPAHRHALNARLSPGKGEDATSNYMAQTPSKPYLDGPPDTEMGEDAIGASGGGQPHDNRGPRLALTYCIAVQGLFPSRS